MIKVNRLKKTWSRMIKPSLPANEGHRLTIEEISRLAAHLIVLVMPAVVTVVVVGKIMSVVVGGPRTIIAGKWIRVKLWRISDIFSHVSLHFRTLMGADEIINEKESARVTRDGEREFLYQNLELWIRKCKNLHLSLLASWRFSVNITKDRWSIITVRLSLGAELDSTKYHN